MKMEKMTMEVKRSKPKSVMYYPIWYHTHGCKMRVMELNERECRLVISSDAATVTISPGRDVQEGGDGWVIDWEVVWCYVYHEVARGRRHFNDEELKAAFGLSDKSGCFGQGALDRFGGDSAQQGKYIRWQNFLNIPCPGTSSDGDPNVSIQINDEMRDAVRRLLVVKW